MKHILYFPYWLIKAGMIFLWHLRPRYYSYMSWIEYIEGNAPPEDYRTHPWGGQDKEF